MAITAYAWQMVDNDGYVDLVQADGNDMEQHNTFINNRIDGWVLASLPLSRLDLEGNWQASSNWEVPIMDKGLMKEWEGNNGVRLADVNSDGFIDIIQADGDDSDQHLTFLNNRKNGWELSRFGRFQSWTKAVLPKNSGGGDNALQLADLNKDGYIDLIQADGDDPAQHLALLNDGKGKWELNPGWVIPLIDNGGFTESGGDGDNGLRVLDVNGDGYPDLVQADGVDQRTVLLNDKVSNWSVSPLYEIPEIDNGGFTENSGDNDNGVRLVDVNGDGLVDILQADDEDQRVVYLNNGNGGWLGQSAWKIPVIHNGALPMTTVQATTVSALQTLTSTVSSTSFRLTAIASGMFT
ncbi:MAG: VCBS repeat-containing protein [Saprospirales bacterium]|nr:VCBS repeat-containing protein [Saprospirales bacterium]